MMRRRHTRSLQRTQDMRQEDDVNPMNSVTNVADCMLVLAVGLLVALVSLYGIDLENPEAADEIIGIEVNLDADEDGEIDSVYEKTGEVYESPSGEYYLVTE